jgi:hypothetical protein
LVVGRKDGNESKESDMNTSNSKLASKTAHTVHVSYFDVKAGKNFLSTSCVLADGANDAIGVATARLEARYGAVRVLSAAVVV